jgi:hypothetical protein
MPISGNDSDPPIIVTGGGGNTLSAPAKNFVSVDFHPDGDSKRKKFKAKRNMSPNIKGVQVEFVTTPPTSQPPVTLNSADQYEIRITFLTDPAVRPKPRKKRAEKKKADTKRSTASKRR